jgi:ABC-type transport system substrate-binding protein
MRKILLAIDHFIRRLISRLSLLEKIIIVLCFIVIAVSAIFIPKKPVENVSREPTEGGLYSEGVLADNLAELDRAINRLTKSGLIRFDEDMELKPALAKSWTIDKDNLEYRFELFEGVSPEEIIETLKAQKNGFRDLEINQEGQTLKIKSQKPIGSLINNLTEPIFSLGPYKIVKQDDTRMVLEANPDWTLGKPYIPKIIIRLYRDEDKLYRALASGDIQGAGSLSISDEKFNLQTMQLQRYLTLFFNLSLPKLQNKGLRQAIKDNTEYSAGIDLELKTLDQPIYMEEAEELKERLAANKINLTVSYFSLDEIKNGIIPNRDYELFLYGLEIGRDPDIYPYYHSSQIPYPGKNLSQYFDLKVDKLLDEAHREIDPNQRREKVAKARKEIEKDIPSLNLRQIVYDYTISRDIKGVKIGQGVTESDRFNNVWEWYIKTKVKNK